MTSFVVILQVKNQEGSTNTDPFMVAHGDLGMKLAIKNMFLAQNTIIYRCNLKGKPVASAT